MSVQRGGADCALCRDEGGAVLWRDERLRVVAVDEPDYPGFVRVVWHAHVREMSDLDPPDRIHLMRIVFAAERALRLCLVPDKVNLASLGNAVPHLHWHVVPRFADDPHFPMPIWGTRQRDADPAQWTRRRARLEALPGLIAGLAAGE